MKFGCATIQVYGPRDAKNGGTKNDIPIRNILLQANTQQDPCAQAELKDANIATTSTDGWRRRITKFIFDHNENASLTSSRCSSSWMAWEPVAVLAEASRPA